MYMARMMKHGRKNRQVGINAVRDHNGVPVTGNLKSKKILANFWAQKFAMKEIDENLAKEFTDKWSQEFPSTNWLLPFTS